jgi:hypothetical protein
MNLSEMTRTSSGNLAIRNQVSKINGQFNEQAARTLIPRPFIPPNRSTIDKILDFFIGDGPNNR